MLRRGVGLAVGLSFFAFSPLLFASHNRGVDARVTLDAQGRVVLSWTGGQPNWTIYRSDDKKDVVSPTREIAFVGASIFTDTPRSEERRVGKEGRSRWPQDR